MTYHSIRRRIGLPLMISILFAAGCGGGGLDGPPRELGIAVVEHEPADLDGASRPALAGQPHLAGQPDAARDGLLGLGRRAQRFLAGDDEHATGRAPRIPAAEMRVRQARRERELEQRPVAIGRHLDDRTIGKKPDLGQDYLLAAVRRGPRHRRNSSRGAPVTQDGEGGVALGHRGLGPLYRARASGPVEGTRCVRTLDGA